MLLNVLHSGLLLQDSNYFILFLEAQTWSQHHISLCNAAAKVKYTVGHKKRATLFGIITPMFHGGFLHFLYQWKQEKILYRKLQNLQLYHNCVSTLPEKI